LIELKLKKIFFFIVYIIIILVLIILFEIILRVFNYGIDTRVFIKVGKKEKYFTDNVYFVNKYYPGIDNKIISLNSNLFKVEKDDHTLRGFVLGGSSAQGYPYNVNHSFGKITEKLINKSSNDKRKLEIINISHTSMSSYYVNDVAKKLLKYKPDFLIIYSGHNEYYGSINSLNGKYVSKKIYLFLKEYKVIQLLMKLLNIEKSIDMGNQTLMENLYNKTTILPEDKKNEYINHCYNMNIQNIFDFYERKNVKIIIIEPISNIIDMPPFKGKGDEELNQEIEKYINVIKENNVKGMKKIIDEDGERYEKENSNIMYLKAVMNKKLNNNNIENFKMAKDYDLIPFRAKSKLIIGLDELIKENMKFNNNLVSINLEKNLLMFANEEIFSNIIFSDHLHFNFKGNLLVSYYLALELSKMFSLNINYKLLEKDYDDPDFYYYDLFFSDINELQAFQNIKILLDSLLFKNMVIGYYNNSLVNQENKFIKEKEMTSYIKDYGLKVYETLFDYYLSKEKYKDAEYMLNSLNFIIPYNKYVNEKLLSLYKLTKENEKAEDIKNKLNNFFEK